MLHYDVIAVGTDGSDGAQKAVRTAASMARAFQAKLIIVTAFYTHHGGVFGAHSSAVSYTHLTLPTTPYV